MLDPTSGFRLWALILSNEALFLSLSALWGEEWGVFNRRPPEDGGEGGGDNINSCKLGVPKFKTASQRERERVRKRENHRNIETYE